jgi:hypothetical protein
LNIPITPLPLTILLAIGAAGLIVAFEAVRKGARVT